jgi:DNA-binding transcriptional ArsR family regulator
MAVKQPKVEKAAEKADIVLHPIRFRILMIASGRRVSAQQIISALPDVPQASAYRHIARLVEAGILQAMEEATPRGTIEKTYTLPDQAADLSREEMAPVSSEDHMRYFTAFATLMLSQFRAYLDRKDRGGKDGGNYWSEAVCLTEAEYEHFVIALKAIQGLAVSHQPSPERRRRLLFTAIIPDVEEM